MTRSIRCERLEYVSVPRYWSSATAFQFWIPKTGATIYAAESYWIYIDCKRANHWIRQPSKWCTNWIFGNANQRDTVDLVLWLVFTQSYCCFPNLNWFHPIQEHCVVRKDLCENIKIDKEHGKCEAWVGGSWSSSGGAFRLNSVGTVCFIVQLRWSIVYFKMKQHLRRGTTEAWQILRLTFCSSSFVRSIINQYALDA